MVEILRTLETFLTPGSLPSFAKAEVSEGVMKMLGEANEALGPLSDIKDDLHSCKCLVGRVLVGLHPSLFGL